MRESMDILFSGAAVGWVVAFAVPLGFGFIALKDARLAKGCFLVAAAWLLGGLTMWGINTPANHFARVIAVFIAFGASGILAVEAIRYTDRKASSESLNGGNPQSAAPPAAGPPEPAAPSPRLTPEKRTPEKPKKQAEPENPAPLPTMDVRFTAEPTNSTLAEAPYAVRVVIQTNVAIQPTSLYIQCDAEVAKGEFHLQGTGAYRDAGEGYVNNDRRTYWFYFGDPAFRPETPLVVTLMSARPIHVQSVHRGPAR
jgi:hypothetical protein